MMKNRKIQLLGYLTSKKVRRKFFREIEKCGFVRHLVSVIKLMIIIGNGFGQ